MSQVTFPPSLPSLTFLIKFSLHLSQSTSPSVESISPPPLRTSRSGGETCVSSVVGQKCVRTEPPFFCSKSHLYKKVEHVKKTVRKLKDLKSRRDRRTVCRDRNDAEVYRPSHPTVLGPGGTKRHRAKCPRLQRSEKNLRFPLMPQWKYNTVPYTK